MLCTTKFTGRLLYGDDWQYFTFGLFLSLGVHYVYNDDSLINADSIVKVLSGALLWLVLCRVFFHMNNLLSKSKSECFRMYICDDNLARIRNYMQLGHDARFKLRGLNDFEYAIIYGGLRSVEIMLNYSKYDLIDRDGDCGKYILEFSRINGTEEIFDLIRIHVEGRLTVVQTNILQNAIVSCDVEFVADVLDNLRYDLVDCNSILEFAQVNGSPEIFDLIACKVIEYAQSHQIDEGAAVCSPVGESTSVEDRVMC